MQPIQINQFIQSCNSNGCLRNTIYNEKTCKRPGKQSNCYRKYLQKLEKNEIKKQSVIEDKEWKEVLNQVHKRDKSCVIWKILTVKEKEYVINNHFDDYKFLAKQLDGAHILGRNNRQYKYNSFNVLLINRYFHRLLTDFKDPVTQEQISKDKVFDYYIRSFNFVHGENIKSEQELKEWLSLNSNSAI